RTSSGTSRGPWRHSGSFTIAPSVTTVTGVSRRAGGSRGPSSKGPSSTECRALAVVVATIATTLTVAVPAAEAGHGHGPSARDVAAGRAAVAHRERQVSRAAAEVAHARAAVSRLAASAEIAVEAYNAANIR